MYEELVKTLREQCSNMDCGNCNTCVKLKAADAIEELQSDNAVLRETVSNLIKHISELSKPRWIPVTEKLPEQEENVLAVRKFLGVKGCPASTYVETAELVGETWVSDSDEYKIARSKHTDPIYWMPLPEPPKEDETCTKTNAP